VRRSVNRTMPTKRGTVTQRLREEKNRLCREIDRLQKALNEARNTSHATCRHELAAERKANAEAYRQLLIERDGYREKLRLALGAMEDAREMVGEREG
jgi:hypothetical protein